MAKEALNKISYRRFAEKCRGAQVTRVTVAREDRTNFVLFRYNARALRGGKRFNGEWVVQKKDRDEEKIKELEMRFLDTIKRDFAIQKISGFGDAAAADAEAAEAPASSS